MPEIIKKISVLMPVYNCGRYVSHAIKSILNQTFRDFDFIIINDGSTDNTEEVVKGFDDKRIIYRKTENKGTSAALNYGLKLCKYNWVARIDSDDINVPNRLETQIRFLGENPGYDIVSSWSVYFRDPAIILFLLREPVEHDDIYDFLDLHNPLNQSSIMYRKKLILEEQYDETFSNNEDYELFYRIRDKARFFNIPEFLVYTRLRPDSKSKHVHNVNLHEMLFRPAFKNLIDSKSKGDHFYWSSVIAWVNYFYGNRNEARSYLKNSFSWRNLAAYITTFLPDKYFNKFIDSRFKYRLQNLFNSTGRYKKELTGLLK